MQDEERLRSGWNLIIKAGVWVESLPIQLTIPQLFEFVASDKSDGVNVEEVDQLRLNCRRS